MSGKLPPLSHTALSTLPVIVLDLETTGLDVRRDRVVQVGAIAMLGPKILDQPRLDCLIDPGVPIPDTSTRIHGLSDNDVEGAIRFEAFVETLRELVSGRVVVGHNIGFDLAVLRYEAARVGVAWHDPPALDLAPLVGALERSLPDLGLESIASLLGVTIKGRHRALGDAMAAAEIFSHLLPRLRDADVRTLGEAQSFAAGRTDLLVHEIEAGWHSTPGSPPMAPAIAPLTRIDSFIFERRLGELMSAPAATIASDATLLEAARIMTERRIGALLVGATDAPPEGILTERDLLRAIAGGKLMLGESTVTQAMTAPVEVMHEHEMLYRALGRMQRMNIRHLCVVNDSGAVVGMISQRDLLRHRSSAADVLGDGLEEANDASALAAEYSRVPEVAGRLLAEDLDGVEIARVVSNELCIMTARAAKITLDQLEAAGRGPAPAPWCLLVLGSGGRSESLLSADQDNALIHAGSADDDPWFAEFGAGIAELLDEAGLPRCKGGVMAANPEWRGPIEQWRARVDQWLRRARPEDLMNIDIFFDLVPVAGAHQLARSLHKDAVDAASRTPTFIALLAEWVGASSPGIGPFGRLRTNAGRIDLKWCGLIPLVNIARTLALRAGSAARSTPDRLRDAVAAGRLAQADATSLIEIHADLLTMVLCQQVVDLDDGVRPSGKVQTSRLDKEETRRLRRHLKRLDEILRMLRSSVV
jgi:CBS domain-containing protein